MSMIGKALIHYEISAQIGRGGMGEVYQAKDTKLGRDVAIKILPEEFARDVDRVARFQREAKLLASLNHPNIASIHGLEESDETNFLVMELIEGDTLADRIKKGPIPVDEALKLALQIVEALEAAHEKGVIHRDLKPANIKITPEGKIKILDFGLAKAFAEDEGKEKPLDSPTLSDAATRQGIILGTAAYMSPEQARGKPVDKRADIWAFGVILFEMLTGKALFEGEDVTSTLARVLEREPDYSALSPNLHPRIRFLLERCLEKEAGNRYSSISDARVEMQKVLADPGGVFVQPPAGLEPQKRTRTTPIWAAAIVLTAIIVGVVIWNLRAPEPKKVMRFDIDLHEDLMVNVDLNTTNIDISSDGSLLAYTTLEGIYLHSMSEGRGIILPETEGAIWPFFSPDSQWVGYIVKGKLKKIGIESGSSVTLCDATLDGGFSWTSDNRILQGSGENILWVSEEGGELEILFNEEGNLLGAPQMLPDGESVLFTTGSSVPHKVMVHSIKSGKSIELFEGSFARYIKTGHIVYGSGNNLYAKPFNLEKLEVTGGPILLVNDIFEEGWIWHYAISDSGTLVYISDNVVEDTNNRFVWVDRDGKEVPISTQPDDFGSFVISPDGTQIALSIAKGGNEAIYIADIELKNRRQLTFDKSLNSAPLWTPDGKSIVFTSNRGNKYGLYQKSADGTGETEVISDKSGDLLFPGDWSKDGKTLVLYNANNNQDEILHMEGNGDIEPLYQETTSYYSSISPDGKWIAYASADEGQNEVYVRPYPEVNKGKWKVSTNGGFAPLWSRDGEELFYWSNDGVMVVDVSTKPRFPNAKILFQRTPVVTFTFGIRGVTWGIHPDGKRFLMMKPSIETGEESEAATTPHKISIVLNWFEELKKRVPVD